MGDKWVGSSTPYLTPSGDTWGNEAASQGRRGGQQVLFVGEVTPPEAVADLLSLATGAKVILRRRLILLDGSPVEVMDSYWPADVAEGTALASPGKIPGGAVTLLAQLGHEAAEVQEEVAARPATDEERGLLGTDSSEWVLVLTRAITDRAARVYEVSEMVTPGRARRLHYAMRVS